MSEIAKLLRLIVQADKEAKVTQITAVPVLTEFESQLSATSGEFRKSLAVYNHSDSGSGDCFYSYTKDGITDLTDTMVIPKGALVDIPIASNLQVYFLAASGEFGNLRVEELA